MFERCAVPILRAICLFLKIFAAFFALRGMLYVVGFRYNIPVVDDIFWVVMGWVMSLGVQ